MSGSKTRILLLITKSNWGGAQRYVYDIATNLDSTHFSLTVAAGGTGEKNSPPGVLGEKLQHAKVPFMYLKHVTRAISPFSEIRAGYSIWRCIRNTNPDVVHLNSSKMGLLGGIIARLQRVPKIVFTVHGFPYTAHQPQPIQWLAQLATALTFRCATDIICICKADQKVIKTFRSARNKVRFIPNGIEQSIPHTPKQSARTQLATLYPDLPAPSSKATWIATGTELHPRKGIQTVIEACAQLAKTGYSFHLCIYGAGPYEQRIREQIKQLELESHVTLLGFVKDLPRQITAFDGFILASYKEGLPYVLLEIAQAGVPLIASDIDGIPDIITHQKTGQLIDPHHTQTIVQAMTNLIEYPDTQRKNAEQLQKHLAQVFSLSDMLRATEGVYNTHLHNKPLQPTES